MTKALPVVKTPREYQPAPVFVQQCPICGHLVSARLESRTHSWMLEHWYFTHDAERVIESFRR